MEQLTILASRGVTSARARCDVHGQSLADYLHWGITYLVIGRRALRAVSVADNVSPDRLTDGCGASSSEPVHPSAPRE